MGCDDTREQFAKYRAYTDQILHRPIKENELSTVFSLLSLKSAPPLNKPHVGAHQLCSKGQGGCCAARERNALHFQPDEAGIAGHTVHSFHYENTAGCLDVTYSL